MRAYDRFALVVDTAGGALGRAAMGLLEVGIDVLYANDLDEAALLAAQETGRLGAVLAPSSLGRVQLDGLLERVCGQLAAGAGALVLVGLEPDPELVAGLAARGVLWGVWEPWEPRALRALCVAAMAQGDGGERRKTLRIPTRVETAVFMGRYRKEVVVHDLSIGGAYMAAPFPFLEGSELHIDFEIPGGRVQGRGRVVNAKTADRAVRADVPDGMGVEFTSLQPGSADALEACVRRWLAGFRLGAGAR